MPDTLRALADDSLDTVARWGGPHAFMAAVAAGERAAVECAAEIDERARRLGATTADVLAQLRRAGVRRGMLTVH